MTVQEMEPEQIAEILSSELDKEGFFNIVSEDGKTLVLYSCAGECISMFIRIEDEDTRIVIPFYSKTGGSVAAVQKLEETLKGYKSIGIIELLEGLIGLEIIFPKTTEASPSQVVDLVKMIQKYITSLRESVKNSFIETDIFL